MNASEFKQEFELVLELPENDFITYFNRDDREFLNDFLFTYFKKSQYANPQFIGKLLNANAQLLLETIRLQQVPFLYPIHWNIIKKVIPSTHSLVNWIDTLDFVKNQELMAWEQFKDAAQKCLNMAPIDVLIYLSWWYESKRLKGHEETGSLVLGNQEKNRETREYSKFVIEHFLSYYFTYSNNLIIQSGTSDVRYVELLKDIENDGKKDLIFNALNILEEWHYFKASLVETICFDLNFELSRTDICYSLYPKSILEESNWYLNGHKYMSMYLSYMKEGLQKATVLVGTGKVIVPNIDTHYGEYNLSFLAESQAVQMLMDDFCISGFEFESNKEEKGVDFPIEMLVAVMGAFCINSRARFIDPVDELFSKNNIIDWKKRLLLHLLQVPSKRYHLPIREYSLEEWKKVAGSQQNFTEKEKDNLSSLLIFDSKKLNNGKDRKRFSRFNSKINLTITPFLKLDGRVFSFTNILGEINQWGYSIVQNALDKNVGKRKRIANDETRVEMERQLGQKFLDQGFEKVSYSEAYKVETSKGFLSSDIDLLVYESGVLLIGELKRTKLRLSLKESWLERWQTNHKAVLQLEKHLRLLKECPQFFIEKLNLPKDFDFSNIRIVPLIFSSSFEDDGQYFGRQKNIQKISYFEICSLLKELGDTAEKVKKNGSLNYLLDAVKKRRIWQNLPVIEPKHWNDVEISLPLKEADRNKVEKYNTSTKLANEAYENKQFSTALAYFFCALEITPNCPYIMESIGNSFSGLKRFSDAEIYYDKALKIIPDSSQILLNSAANYIDNKKYDEYVEQLLKIMELYGDYSPIRCRVKFSIDRLYYNGEINKLKAKQAFEKKWKEYQFYDFDGCNDLLKSMMSFLFQ